MKTLKRHETKAERIRRKLDAFIQDNAAFKRLVLVVINDLQHVEPYRTKRAIVIGGKWCPFELRAGETWQEAVRRLNPEPAESVEEERRAAANE